MGHFVETNIEDVYNLIAEEIDELIIKSLKIKKKGKIDISYECRDNCLFRVKVSNKYSEE